MLLRFARMPSRSLRAKLLLMIKILSGEEEEAVMCEASGKMSGASVPTNSGGRLGNRGYALDWQVGDRLVICDNGASSYMSYSSTGMINCREAKTFMEAASGTKYPI